MSFQKKLSHAAAVAKWKAEQEARLLVSQNQVREVEKQISSQKVVLAEAALTLLAQDQVQDEGFKKLYATILGLQQKVKEQQALQETIKQEQPPE
jgi:hypothetical protein